MRGRRSGQGGLTLVELMVALAIGLIIAVAAVASLIVARIGFTSVDSSTELRENARLAATMIQRIVDESGFQDMAGGQFPGISSQAIDPNLHGYDNAMLVPNPGPVPPLPANLPTTLVNGTRNAANCGAWTDSTCMNGSSILVVRYWGVSNPPGPGNPADGSVVNCSGGKEPELATGPSYSIFSVAVTSTGEPALVCTYLDSTTGTWTSVPLVSGVESFQVLYGVTGNFAPNTCMAQPMVNFQPNVTTLINDNGGNSTGNGTDATTAYLTASEVDPGTCGNSNNWTYVRTLRIGLLMRGPQNSQVVPSTTGTTFNVLQMQMPNASYFVSPSSNVTTPADGRLRMQSIFTITMRNLQQTRQ